MGLWRSRVRAKTYHWIVILGLTRSGHKMLASEDLGECQSRAGHEDKFEHA